jgi:hypothetical protein
MKAGQGLELHPGAAQDITEIWEFVAGIIGRRPRVLKGLGAELDRIQRLRHADQLFWSISE